MGEGLAHWHMASGSMQARCESTSLSGTTQAAIEFLNSSSGAHELNGMIRVRSVDLRVADTKTIGTDTHAQVMTQVGSSGW